MLWYNHNRRTSATPMNNILHLPYDSYIFMFGRLLLPSLRRKLSCISTTSQECSVNSWHTDLAIKMADLWHASFPNAFSWRKILIFRQAIISSNCDPKLAFIMPVHSFLIKRFYNTSTTKAHRRYTNVLMPDPVYHLQTLLLVVSMFQKSFDCQLLEISYHQTDNDIQNGRRDLVRLCDA